MLDSLGLESLILQGFGQLRLQVATSPHWVEALNDSRTSHTHVFWPEICIIDWTVRDLSLTR